MPDRFADRYELRGELGRGGYAVVREALDHITGRHVALKIFQGLPRGIAYREAYVLTRLESPYILRVFNADVWNDIPFMASAIAPQGDVERHIQPFGVAPTRASRWVINTLTGLEAVHRGGLVHRDIKTTNVFLDDDDGARIGDFGEVEVLAADGRVQAAGDPRVRAPEMFTSSFGGVASDLYSVSATAWRMLTGSYPIEPSDEMPNDEYGALVAAGVRRRLRDCAPHVPGALARVIEKGLSLSPADRFTSAEAMAGALVRVPVPNRKWTEHAPHEGHARCWMSSESQLRRTAASVCVFDSSDGAGAVVIEVRRQPSGARVRSLCRTVESRRVGVELRATFDRL